jgi:putative addiction module component (TIGR02574 family)
MTKQQLLAEAMKLDAKEGEELAEELWHQVTVNEQLSASQVAELHRRGEAIDQGKATWIPGEDVLRELRERYRQ